MEFASSPAPASAERSSDTTADTADAPLCMTPGCSKAGTLRCPTCKEMGIAGQIFCSQSCFKSSWDAHKLVHKARKGTVAAQQQQAQQQASLIAANVRLPSSFDGFAFTGKLRPGHVAPRASVPSHIPKPDYADTGVPTSELRVKGNNVVPVLNEEDRAHMRRACRCGAANGLLHIFLNGWFIQRMVPGYPAVEAEGAATWLPLRILSIFSRMGGHTHFILLAKAKANYLLIIIRAVCSCRCTTPQSGSGGTRPCCRCAAAWHHECRAG